eukprot:tig00000042_g15576.t1
MSTCAHFHGQVYDSGLIKPDFTTAALDKPWGFWTNGAYKNLFKHVPQSPLGVRVAYGDKVRIEKPGGGVLNFGELEVIGAVLPTHIDECELAMAIQVEDDAREIEIELADADEFEAEAAAELEGGALGLCDDPEAAAFLTAGA